MSNRTVQRILQQTRRGTPMDSDALRDMGVSAALASNMVKSGWLERLSQGVYLLTGDTPSPDGCLGYLSRCIPGLHVGGATALSWVSEGHRGRFDDEVALWGQLPYRIPSWFGMHLPYSFQTTTLFDDASSYEQGLVSLPDCDPGVRVSVPERAILELASDIGKRHSLAEAIALVGEMPMLRPDVLDEFLGHCKRVKVVRLVRDLGTAVAAPWVSTVQRHVDRLSAGKRWSNVTKNGRLTLKP